MMMTGTLPTFCTSGLKSVYERYNIHTCFPIIASNVVVKLVSDLLWRLNLKLDVWIPSFYG